MMMEVSEIYVVESVTLREKSRTAHVKPKGNIGMWATIALEMPAEVQVYPGEEVTLTVTWPTA